MWMLAHRIQRIVRRAACRFLKFISLATASLLSGAVVLSKGDRTPFLKLQMQPPGSSVAYRYEVLQLKKENPTKSRVASLAKVAQNHRPLQRRHGWADLDSC